MAGRSRYRERARRTGTVHWKGGWRCRCRVQRRRNAHALWRRGSRMSGRRRVTTRHGQAGEGGGRGRRCFARLRWTGERKGPRGPGRCNRQRR